MLLLLLTSLLCSSALFCCNENPKRANYTFFCLFLHPLLAAAALASVLPAGDGTLVRPQSNTALAVPVLEGVEASVSAAFAESNRAGGEGLTMQELLDGSALHLWLNVKAEAASPFVLKDVFSALRSSAE